MLLLRNLVYNSQSDIQAVLHWSSNALLVAVRDALQRSAGQTAVRASKGCIAVNGCCMHGSVLHAPSACCSACLNIRPLKATSSLPLLRLPAVPLLAPSAPVAWLFACS